MCRGKVQGPPDVSRLTGPLSVDIEACIVPIELAGGNMMRYNAQQRAHNPRPAHIPQDDIRAVIIIITFIVQALDSRYYIDIHIASLVKCTAKVKENEGKASQTEDVYYLVVELMTVAVQAIILLQILERHLLLKNRLLVLPLLEETRKSIFIPSTEAQVLPLGHFIARGHAYWMVFNMVPMPKHSLKLAAAPREACSKVDNLVEKILWVYGGNSVQKLRQLQAA
ncbi:hypothetical protein EDD18DRAFT_1109421 [Armillaria luteobubalina]|uniref:Uncharacterized protein n=1 Tax=Armillaria luteobubalina TaxID=153913 RepID=A0AA39PX43_9AGAR|nr:hypothetical protein EDD18DRAFT_1109421 [Armillaria luteobubalina]